MLAYASLTNHPRLNAGIIRSSCLESSESDFAVIDVFDAGVNHVVDVLHLLAEKLVVASVAEASLDLAID